MTREELGRKYFGGFYDITPHTPNFHIVSLLSDAQCLIEYNEGIPLDTRQHYVEMLNDIKRVLIKEDHPNLL